MSDAGPLVCGFADEATQLAGLAWELPGESGGLLARSGEISSADAKITADGDVVRVELEGDGLTCEAELSPRAAEAQLADAEGTAAAGEPSSAVCQVKAQISGAGEKRTIDCFGHITRWRRSPTDDAELVRHLVIPAPNDGLLLFSAKREPGAGDHSAERTAAWRLDPEGHAIAFAEALLSTQYDEAGRQTRAGLELWPGETDSPPLRAAGVVLEGQVANGERVSAALLHSSAEGTTGLGSYLIWRA